MNRESGRLSLEEDKKEIEAAAPTARRPGCSGIWIETFAVLRGIAGARLLSC